MAHITKNKLFKNTNIKIAKYFRKMLNIILIKFHSLRLIQNLLNLAHFTII